MSARRFLPALIAALGLALATGAQSQAPAPEASVFGLWRNPKGSVEVDIRPCGANACGTIVWANAKAKEDARKAGTKELIGLQVFRDLRQDQSGAWRGRVFAPDMGMTFSGTARLVGAQNLRAKGCVLAGIICKSQLWTRVG